MRNLIYFAIYEKEGWQLHSALPGGLSGPPWQWKDASEKLPVQKNIRRKCWDNQLLAQILDEIIPWRSTDISVTRFYCLTPQMIAPAQLWRGGGNEQPGQKSLKSALLQEETSELRSDEMGMSLAEAGAWKAAVVLQQLI